MFEKTWNDVEINGRFVAANVHGDTREELEMKALDVAREIFGPDVQLEVIPVYVVSYLASAEAGRKGEASILVREVT